MSDLDIADLNVVNLSRWQLYPEYKETDVEYWFDSVPSNWGWVQIIRFTKLRTGGTPSRDNLDYWTNGTINWMSSGEVNKRRVHEIDSKITHSGMKNSNVTLLPIHSVMMALNGQGKTKAMVATLEIETTCNQSLAAFICDEQRIHYNYLFYYLDSQYNKIRGLVGEQRDGLSLELIRSIYIPVPSLSEQQTIASFLDRETSRIDTLIAKKRAFISLMQEKHSALINHVVTKGLNPDASMKDSAIEWLGEIPSHWKTSVKLNSIALDKKNSFVNGPFGSDLLTSEITPSGDVPVIYIRDISARVYKRISEAYITYEKANELKACRTEPGDILIAKVGEPPGTAAIYPMEQPTAIVTQDVIRMKLKSDWIVAEYFVYIMNSKYMQTQIDMISVESTRTRISLGAFKNLRIILPPVEEQALIIEYIKHEEATINLVIEKTMETIEKLQEYRAALISSAVTGKIDVRGHPER